MQAKRGTWLMALALLIAAPLRADDTTKDFRSAKAAITKQMRDRAPETRVAAVRKFASYPNVDAAKILLLQGLESSFEDVRQASFETLLKFKEERTVCDYLHGELLKDLKKKPIDAKAPAALGVLLASDIPEIAKPAQQQLDQIAEMEGGAFVLVGLVDALGLVGDDICLTVLTRLRDAALFQKFGPRRALAQAYIKIRKPAAVAELVKILQRVQGEVRNEIMQYLAGVSGQRFQLPDDWADWWKKSQATFEFPPAKDAKAATFVSATVPTYYGLPLYGAKIVFVIDCSTSMLGLRIDAAKRELIKAIKELPTGCEFNVLAFSQGVLPWQSQLVPSSKEMKEAATLFVMGLTLGSRTNSYDALESALSFEGEAIYFLTDGAPNGGKVTRPDEIVTVISKINRVRRMTINAIGVGVGPDGNLFDVFLKTLASQNFGTYRRVDE